MGTENERRVLLTGATGMIGANLARRLVADRYQVFALLRQSSSRLRLQSVEKQLEILYGDVTDPESVETAVNQARPDVVFHLASTPFNPPTISAEEHLQVNVLGTLYLLEALRKVPGVRTVFTSSTAVYGSGSKLREDRLPRPETVLGASKACAGILLQTFSRLHGMETVELRLFTPYGPWENPRRLIPHVVLSALEGRDVPLSLGDQERDLVYVDDVVDALLLAANQPVSAGSVFNIGSGLGKSVREVAELTLKLMGNPVKLLIGALPTRPDEIMQMSADIGSARDQIGWQPKTSLEDGLRQSIAWLRENRELALNL